MAWLNNLAEKAEYLLDRLDHKASVVLLQNDNKNLSPVEDDTLTYFSDYSNNLTNTLIQINNDNISSENNIQNVSIPQHEERVLITKNDNELIDNHKKQNNFIKSNENSTKDIFEEYNKQRNIIEELQNQNTDLKLEYAKSLEEIAVLKRSLNVYKSKNVLLDTRLKEMETCLVLTEKEIGTQRNQSHIENVKLDKNKLNDQNEYILKLIKARDEQEKKISELNERLEIIQNDLIITQKYCSMYKEDGYTLRQNLEKEEKNRIALEEELYNNKQELNKLYEELKTNINTLNLKNEELINIQKQLDNQYSSTETEEMESKFHVLTKTLIMKQNSLETLTTERNALRLQLERLKADYATVLTELNMRQKSIQTVNFDENGKSASIFDVAPFNGSLSQRVKRTITTLNSFNIRLGVFLRRYPVARIFLLCYMIVLQIWVVLILFAYIPNSY